jgi:formate dehydrogenase major subunit
MKADAIRFKLNGSDVAAAPGEMIIEAAARYGVEIPHLCYTPGMRPDGNCRACMVEIKGERVLAPSCCRMPANGMEVSSTSQRAVHAQKIVVEMLASDVPERVYKPDSELAQWQRFLGIDRPRFAPRAQPLADPSHPAMSVNLDACIQCTRCVRACREEQVNDVIGFAFRGAASKIVFDLDDPMGASTCVACGECVQACPTGALAPAKDAYLVPIDKKVASVCPYCGVGCQLTYHVNDNTIVRVEGRDGLANRERLCVKGRFGFDYVAHPQRLTKPLIRKPGMPKNADFVMDPANPLAVFREATWEEALDLAGGTLAKIRDEHGGGALAGFGSAKGSNEEAYLFQKLVRTGFGSNNVDHCTRLCHASSVAALLEGIGSGAVSNPVMDVLKADVVLLIGANPVVNHPVAATWIKNAAKAGTRLILADPRRSELARHATYYLQFKPDTDVALLNAMMHTIVEEGLVSQSFIDDRTSGYEELRKNVEGHSPEAMAPVCGIPAQTIREVARLYATSKGSMILWGMGISQHVHGTDNARCLIALAMMTGQVGRPGTGLHPLRGQNNVQGASDAGLIPMMYPDYRRVDSAGSARQLRVAMGSVAGPDAGTHGRRDHGRRARGQDPRDVHHGREPGDVRPGRPSCARGARRARNARRAGHFPDRDGLSRRRHPAGVSLPGEDGNVHQYRSPGPARAPGARAAGRRAPGPDDHHPAANRLGLDWRYADVSEVFDEMRTAMPSIAGITWERLERESAVTYPCEKEGDPGTRVVFTENFPTASGRGKFVPAKVIPAAEQPDSEYPFVLITGRQLEHWHTGSMTRRTEVLDALEPNPVASLHSLDLAAMNVAPDGMITVASRRGSISLRARADDGTPRGAVFIPFCYYEAAANLLTNPVLDPFGKIPEFKYCAVRVTPGGEESETLGYDSAQDRVTA